MTTAESAVAAVAAPGFVEADELSKSMENLPYAWGGPLASGVLRANPEDFIVEERLSVEPSGQGTHWWLQIEKRGVNTQWVARDLARRLGVAPSEVGYAGMKDRHAVARQWFSVPDQAGVEARLLALEPTDAWRMCDARRHERKLRHAVCAGNRFDITLREVMLDPARLDERIARISTHGVPNYFTEQRFGYDNLRAAAALFAAANASRVARHERGIYLSAARSALFNLVLAQRVNDGTWRRLLPGEAVVLAGTHSFFVAAQPDAELSARLAARDIAPSAPLWGAGAAIPASEALSQEQVIMGRYPSFCAGLAAAGMHQERRQTVLYVADFVFEFDEANHVLRVRFDLPAGSYATGVVRELVDYRQAERSR